MSEPFDAIIVGAGQAGPALAGRLTETGRRVALIERGRVGGTCVNTGCTPTKAMVASAYAAHAARRGGDYGFQAGPVTVDLAAVTARAQRIAADSRKGVEDWLSGMKGLTLERGHARFISSNTLEVEGRRLTAPQIFLNTGGRPARPALKGIDSVSWLDSTAMLSMTTLPKRLIVVGGSYIGLEFAQMFRRFGAEVAIVEMGPRLIAREDPEISEAIRGIMEVEGITVRTGATCISLSPHADGVEVGVDCHDGAPSELGSHVLLATGRQPNTDDLGLEAAGIVTDRRGYITVNERLETNVPGIWALGDCNGRGAFTHTAWNDHEIVAANLLDGGDRRVSQRIASYALYTDPPLGRVGLTEAQAREAGHKLLLSSRPMTRVARAIEKGETQGLMKIVADAETRHILGAAIIGPGGDEAISGLLAAMGTDVPLDTLRWAVPIHPTVSELVPTLLLGLTPTR